MSLPPSLPAAFSVVQHRAALWCPARPERVPLPRLAGRTARLV